MGGGRGFSFTLKLTFTTAGHDTFTHIYLPFSSRTVDT
jgi:hypothetical protein